MRGFGHRVSKKEMKVEFTQASEHWSAVGAVDGIDSRKWRVKSEDVDDDDDNDDDDDVDNDNDNDNDDDDDDDDDADDDDEYERSYRLKLTVDWLGFDSIVL